VEVVSHPVVKSTAPSASKIEEVGIFMFRAYATYRPSAQAPRMEFATFAPTSRRSDLQK
jgi:hypothetical protein